MTERVSRLDKRLEILKWQRRDFCSFELTGKNKNFIFKAETFFPIYCISLVSERIDNLFMSRHLERLLKIDNLLRSSNLQTSDTLADALEVTERTIRSDLAFLRDRFHAPLEYKKKTGWHYSFLLIEWLVLPNATPNSSNKAPNIIKNFPRD